MKKPFTALLLALVLLASLRTAGAAGPNGTISVDLYDHAAGRYQSVQADVVTLTLDGAPLSGDVPALVQAGRTLVPVRLVAEALAAEVLWVQETGQVILKRGTDTVVLTLGSSQALVNGQSLPLPDGVPATVVRYQGMDRTTVPLRFVSEQLGAIGGLIPVHPGALPFRSPTSRPTPMPRRSSSPPTTSRTTRCWTWGTGW